MSLSLAVAIREQTVAHRAPPPSEPANRWFLRPKRDGSDRTFNRIVVEVDTAIVQETAEGWPAGEGVADCLGETAAARDAAKLHLEPGLHRFDERPGLDIAHGLALLSGTSPDVLLDCIKLADPAQNFGSDGRPGGLMQVVKLPACVCPTGCQHDVAVCGQPFEAGVTVNLQDAAECFEVSGGALRLAIGAVEVDGGRRIAPAPRPIATRVEPQSARLSAAADRCAHRTL